MEMFSNWIFWVVLCSIIFVFALIGFLSENSKKKKEKKKETSEVKTSEEAINTSITDVPEGSTLNLDNGTWNNQVTIESNKVSSDDFSKLPEVNVQSIGGSAINDGSLGTTVNSNPLGTSVNSPSNDSNQLGSSINEPVVQSVQPTSNLVNNQPVQELNVTENAQSSNQVSPEVNVQPNNTQPVENSTVKSSEEVMDEAASTLFDNSDDSDVWKV